MALSSQSARAFSVLAARAPSSLAGGVAARLSTSRTQAVTDATTESATTTATTNPLLQQDALPQFARIQPADVTPAVTELLQKMQDELAALEAALSADEKNNQVTYDAVVPVVERMQFPLGYAWGVAGHLNGVKNGEELRQAYEANQPAIVQTFSKFSQSKPLYDALSKIQQEELEKASEDDFEVRQKRRAVELSLRSMKLGGVALEGAEKERFNESEFV